MFIAHFKCAISPRLPRAWSTCPIAMHLLGQQYVDDSKNPLLREQECIPRPAKLEVFSKGRTRFPKPIDSPPYPSHRPVAVWICGKRTADAIPAPTSAVTPAPTPHLKAPVEAPPSIPPLYAISTQVHNPLDSRSMYARGLPLCDIYSKQSAVVNNCIHFVIHLFGPIFTPALSPHSPTCATPLH